VASIYHFRRGLHPHHDHGDHLATLRALVGGLMAIVLLAALVAGITGGAAYALFLGVTTLLK
jgi:hypothetical protein